MTQQHLISIAVDLMGGDFGFRPVVSAVKNFLARTDAQFPHLSVHLFGDASVSSDRSIESLIHANTNISLHQSASFIKQGDSPSLAIKNQRNSSMAEALRSVKEGDCDVCLSLGNTGAYVALSKTILGMQANLSRPVICRALPQANKQQSTWIMDIGANVDSSPEQLYEFALLGNTLAVKTGIDSPKICLLNIGTEKEKGNQQVRKAAKIFQASDLNFSGFIEADDLYHANCNLVICDGFVGNTVLKASEGVARFIISRLESVLGEKFSVLLGGIAQGELKQQELKRRLDLFNPDNYNGAPLLGLKGLAVKSHAAARVKGIEHALELSCELAAKSPDIMY